MAAWERSSTVTARGYWVSDMVMGFSSWKVPCVSIIRMVTTTKKTGMMFWMSSSSLLRHVYRNFLSSMAFHWLDSSCRPWSRRRFSEKMPSAANS